MSKIDNQFKEAYDNQYTEKESQWRELGAKYKAENIIRVCRGHSFKNILEVGAGDGSILQALDKNSFGEKYSALEISESGIQKIKSRKIGRLNDVQSFDGYHFPFNDQEFDLVIFSHVLEHVEHERIILREIARVSEYQSIEVPRDYRFGIDMRIEHFMAYGHINVYTPSSIKYLLKTEGFQILDEYLSINAKEVSLYSEFDNRNRKKNFLRLAAFHIKYGIKSLLSSQLPTRFSHNYINNITLLTKSGTKKSIF